MLEVLSCSCEIPSVGVIISVTCIMQIYKDLINIIALYLTSIRRIPRRGMRPDFGSGGVARPLSALLRLAMLARRLAARHRPPKLGSGAESITRLQDMMRCVIGQRCCADGAFPGAGNVPMSSQVRVYIGVPA
jgi:hypothetical protein